VFWDKEYRRGSISPKDFSDFLVDPKMFFQVVNRGLTKWENHENFQNLGKFSLKIRVVFFILIKSLDKFREASTAGGTPIGNGVRDLYCSKYQRTLNGGLESYKDETGPERSLFHPPQAI